MRINNPKLIKYFFGEDTDYIPYRDDVIIDLNVIGEDDFEEVGQILQQILADGVVTVIPSVDNPEKLHQFQEYFSKVQFKGQPILGRTGIYAQGDEQIENCSDEELADFLYVANPEGATQRNVPNFVASLGFSRISIGTDISREAMGFILNSTTEVNFENDELLSRYYTSWTLSPDYLVLDIDRKVLNIDRLKEYPPQKDDEYPVLKNVTAQEFEELMMTGLINSVKITNLVLDNNLHILSLYYDIIKRAGVESFTYRSNDGIVGYDEISRLEKLAEEVIPKDEKDRTRFIDLSKYEEYELAYIAGALQDNFRNDSYSEIHVLSDRYSVHKLQDFLGQISVNTMSPEGADIFGCITIDTNDDSLRRIPRFHRFDSVERINQGEECNASDYSSRFPKAKIIKEAYYFDETENLRGMTDETLAKILHFAALIKTETPEFRQRLEDISQREGLDHYVTDSGCFLNYSRCEKSGQKLIFSALTQEEYDLLRYSGYLVYFEDLIHPDPNHEFINEQTDRLFKYSPKTKEIIPAFKSKTIDLCRYDGSVEEISPEKCAQMAEKINRYFQRKELPLANESPVIDLNYFTEEELKYVAIYLGQSYNFHKNSQYTKTTFVIINDDKNVDKAGILLSELFEKSGMGILTAPGFQIVTSNPAKVQERLDQRTFYSYTGSYVSDRYVTGTNINNEHVKEKEFTRTIDYIDYGPVNVGELSEEGLYALLKYGTVINSQGGPDGIDHKKVEELLQKHQELADSIIILENGKIVNVNNEIESFWVDNKYELTVDNISLADYDKMVKNGVACGKQMKCRVTIKEDRPQDLTEEFLDKACGQEGIKIVVTKENIKEVLNSPLYKKHPESILFQIRNINEISKEDVKELIDSGIKQIQIYDPTTERHQTLPYDSSKFYYIKEHMDTLTSEIPDGLSEMEIAAILYFRVATSYEYDFSAVDKSPSNATHYAEVMDSARNLENAALKGKTVCAGYTEVLRCALQSKGIETEYVRCECPDDDAHAYLRAKIDGVWYNFDPTWDNPNLSISLTNDGAHISELPKHFMRADNELSKKKMNRKGRICDTPCPEKEVERVFRDLYDGKLGPIIKMDAGLVGPFAGTNAPNVRIERITFDEQPPEKESQDYIVEKNKLASLDGDKPNGPPASGVHFEKKEDPQKDEKDGIRNRIKRFFQDLFTRNKPKELPKGEMEKEDEPKPEPQNPWKVDNIGNIEPIIKDDKKGILENNSKITSDDTNKDTERDE